MLGEALLPFSGQALWPGDEALVGAARMRGLPALRMRRAGMEETPSERAERSAPDVHVRNDVLQARGMMPMLSTTGVEFASGWADAASDLYSAGNLGLSGEFAH